jgi:hypothetical protein
MYESLVRLLTACSNWSSSLCEIPAKKIIEFLGPLVRGKEAKLRNIIEQNPNSTDVEANIAGAIDQSLPVVGANAASTPNIAVSNAKMNDALESAAAIQTS